MSDSATIRLNYKYTYPILKEGIRAASRQINRRGPSVRQLGYALMVGSMIIVVLLSAVIPAVLGLGPEVVLLSFCSYVAAIALLWAYGVNYVGAVAQDMLRTSLYQGDIEMEIGNAGVSIQGNHTRCWLEWAAIGDLVDLKSGLGLFSGCCVYPVPDNALPSGMSREQLCDQIESWRKAAT